MARQFLIVDDHPIVQRAMAQDLAEIEPGCEVLLAGRLEDALRLLRSASKIDLILFDLRLPDTAGVEGLVTLRKQHPDCRVVVVSAEVDSPMIIRCLDLGAAGYIPKNLPNDTIRSALRLVASGCAYVPPQILAGERLRGDHGASMRSPDPRRLGLTDRQVDVLRLILRGLPNKLICRELEHSVSA
ncbi:MAG TPA: response regulator transcription factor [Quisquiliibacterium sp.]|nr:response regulator transcription factor [Quisquiliibacterium sp.]